jgi:hypothetical protein
MSLNANPKKSALRKSPLVSASRQSRQFPIVAPHQAENGARTQGKSLLSAF